MVDLCVCEPRGLFNKSKRSEWLKESNLRAVSATAAALALVEGLRMSTSGRERERVREKWYRFHGYCVHQQISSTCVIRYYTTLAYCLGCVGKVIVLVDGAGEDGGAEKGRGVTYRPSDRT